jgi:hypothetical protein
MDRQGELALLQGLVASQRRVEEITSSTEKLRLSLAARAETIKRLQQLSLATASLLSSVDSTAASTEQSSLQVLTKLGSATAVTPEDDEAEPDLTKVINGKFLSQLMGLVAEAARAEKGEVGIVPLIQLELQLNELLKKAEEKEIVPRTQDKRGWKKRIADHQPIYDQILRMAKGSGDGEELEDDQGEE